MNAEKALAEIAEAARRQYVDWMHFHEVAMAEPFKAEAEAQAFARRILGLAVAALSASRPTGGER